MPYVAKYLLFNYISINYSKKSDPTDVIDKWNNWVFNIGSNGYFNGEERRNSFSINGSLSADRVTEDWKINIGLSSNYNESNYDFENDPSITNITRSQHFSGFIAKSITQHWSAGF